MRAPEVVVLGGPNSGKTHYAGQLYGRLRRRPGELSLRQDKGTPTDLRALEEVLGCLENGHAAAHTPASTWAEIVLPLVGKQGNAINLRWPDYGGEQLRAVSTDRAVTEAWQPRLAKADGWALLIRLTLETTYPDALTELLKRPQDQKSRPARAVDWDANARWVELLQILLHVAGLGTASRLRRPRLAVLLSCYDELNEGPEPPRSVLARRLPLVSSFLESNWSSEAVSVWGLSALGRLLEKGSANEDFINDGPEAQGWVIPPMGGDRDHDLSKPLAWLLEPR